MSSYCTELRYAYNGGVDWQIETVDVSAVVGGHTSLALDAAGRPHITYCSLFTAWYHWDCDDLKYAYHDGLHWQIETVDEEGHAGQYASLALDTGEQPHISYHDAANGDLKYAGRCVPLQGVVIEGPPTLLAGQAGLYSAVVVPITATWSALRWDNGTIASTAAYSWTLPGTHTIAVTATNLCGQAQAIRTVQVLESWPYDFFLPLLVR